MRVVAGAFKGCPLQAPVGTVARPTTDRVKEAMFSLLGLGWHGKIAIDLFAGSGALGLEAVSRGADGAVFVDNHLRSVAAVRENMARCLRGLAAAGADSTPTMDVWRLDWKDAWQRVVERNIPVGWVFIDPPYGLNLWPDVLDTIAAANVAVGHGVVCEHPKAMELSNCGPLRMTKHKVYGDIALTLYRDERGDT